MNKKINIAELLKDCPKGMELDCSIFNGKVCFEGVDYSDCFYPIRISVNSVNIERLDIWGQYNTRDYAQCVIFPKGKTTWKGFIPPCKFNSGDVLVSELGNIVLFSHIDSNNFVHYHCIIPVYGNFRIEENTNIGVGRYYDCVLANEQQKQRMYDKIKCSGYKYNQSINKLEKIKSKFKVGDIIQDEDSYKVKITAIDIEDEFYTYESLIAKGIGTITFHEQDNWALMEYQVGDHFINPRNNCMFVITKIRNDENYDIQSLGGYYPPDMKKHILDNYTKVNKWDPKWLKPFDKVLVRDSQRDYWSVALFSHIGNNEIYPYIAFCTKFKYCIPYNVETKHLVGTTLEEPEFYKI